MPAPHFPQPESIMLKLIQIPWVQVAAQCGYSHCKSLVARWSSAPHAFDAARRITPWATK